MQRSTLTVGLLLLALAANWLAWPQRSWAQEEGDAAAPVATQPADQEDVSLPAPRSSYLGWLYNSLGLTYSLIYLSLSFLFVTLFVSNLVNTSMSRIAPMDLAEAFKAHLDAKQFSEAYELANADDSFLGKILAAGLGKLAAGAEYPRAIQAMEELGEDLNLRRENMISYMGLIGTLAPMIGLLGTIQGMIEAFDAIARSGAAPKPSELARGIATAHATTLIGLMIAIPAIAAYNVMRNFLAEKVLYAGVLSEELMSRFEKPT